MRRLFIASEVKLPWTIFLYTNNYLRDFDSPCKHFPRILGLCPYGLHDRFGGCALLGLVILLALTKEGNQAAPFAD